MRGGSKVTALLAAALLAVGLSACGGGGGSTSSTSTAPAAGSKQAATSPSSAGAGKSGGSHKSSGGSASQQGSGGGSSAAHSDSGGGAAQFKTHGGDNSIQEFGGEGGGSERDQAAVALHGYLDARAGGEWAKACSYMASGMTKSLQQLGGGAQSMPGGQGGKPKSMGCPQLMAAMSAGMPAYLKHDLTQADVGALRIEGDRAFLLFRGAHHTNYFMPMANEGGHWKVGALAASALP